MSDEQLDEPSRYCTAHPPAGTHVLALADPCKLCGHTWALHVGVGHCPVCEMVDHNSRMRGGGSVEIRVEGQTVAAKTLASAIEAAQRRRPFGH